MNEHTDILARGIEHVNSMPAPTWSWLAVNDTSIEPPRAPTELDAGRTRAAVCVEIAQGAPDIASVPADAFERALDELDARHPLRRASAPGDEAHRARADAGEPLDVPAISAYQRRAIEREERLSAVEAFETGMGPAACAYLRERAGDPIVIDARGGERARVAVRIRGVDAAAAAAAIDIVARPDAEVALAISMDSPASGVGLVGASLRVLAGARSRVRIECVQTLDDTWVALDDTGLLLDDDARVSVRHTVLGAGRSYTGLAGDLLGDGSRVEVNTDYLGGGTQLRDFNYVLHQRGRRTAGALTASGVLAGASSKTLRGTIELVHGCKGSQGSERESVLLADRGARSKTVPVILCDEDDVAGNHGATIGHIGDDQLFYLATRGISAEAAEKLFIRAKLEDAAMRAPDERVRAGVIRLGSALVEDFEEEIA